MPKLSFFKEKITDNTQFKRALEAKNEQKSIIKDHIKSLFSSIESQKITKQARNDKKLTVVSSGEAFLKSLENLQTVNDCIKDFDVIKKKFEQEQAQLSPLDLTGMLTRLQTRIEQIENPQFLKSTLGEIGQSNKKEIDNARQQIEQAKEKRKFGPDSQSIQDYMNDTYTEVTKLYKNLADASNSTKDTQQLKQDMWDFSEKISDSLEDKIYRTLMNNSGCTEPLDRFTSVEEVKGKYGPDIANKFTEATNEAIKLTDTIIQPMAINFKDEWHENLKAFMTSPENKKGLFLDCDGTLSHFVSSPEDARLVQGFVKALTDLLDKGYNVALITGRPIDGGKGLLKLLSNSGVPDQLIDRIHIFGNHGAQYRGLDRNVQVPPDIQEKIAPYAQEQNNLLDHIQKQLIEQNYELKGLGITVERKLLGATIHYQEVEESKHKYVEDKLKELLAKILPHANRPKDFTKMDDKTYKNFTHNEARASYEIRLNPEETGVTVDKGTAVTSLTKTWEIVDGMAVGDDFTDTHMDKALKKCSEDPNSSLQRKSFLGAKHIANDTHEAIMNNSTAVLDGPTDVVRFLRWMAKRAVPINQTLNHEIETAASKSTTDAKIEVF